MLTRIGRGDRNIQKERAEFEKLSTGNMQGNGIFSVESFQIIKEEGMGRCYCGYKNVKVSCLSFILPQFVIC